MRKQRIAVMIVILGILLQPLPAQAYTQAFWHVIRNGSRGADVLAAEYLLVERGFMSTANSVFDATTETAVRNFQAAVGLTQNGMIGGSTWPLLVLTASSSTSGNEVRAVQSLLNSKRSAGLTVNGTFNASTETAVRNFQIHAGLANTGVVDSETWKNLIWHYMKVPTGVA